MTPTDGNMSHDPVFAYHIANFTRPPGSPQPLFAALIDQATAADRAGFDRIHVMDHLYQLQPAGHPHDPMFESYTTLAALAQHVHHADLAALVTGTPYRNPALLAKVVTTLDHASFGRAQLGIGAGWYELEHRAFGYDFQAAPTRLDRMGEALEILSHLLRPESEALTHQGDHYRTEALVNSPPPTRRVPIIVGGDGERVTLRLAARFADESNLLCPAEEIPRKLDVIAGHCDAEGRNREELRVTHLTRVLVAPSQAIAEAEFQTAAAAGGMSPEVAAMAREFLTIGDPDAVGEELRRRLDLGLDGLTISLNVNGAATDRIELLGQVVAGLR